MPSVGKWLLDLACGRCAREHSAGRPQNTCTSCGGPLLCRYRIEPGALPLDRILSRPAGQNRLFELMPTAAGMTPTLGEGATPLLTAPRLADLLDLPNLRIKDESQNPTCSFKARGMATAMARVRELGIGAVCLPSAGNAGGAAAAYGALLGIEVHVFVPESTPGPLRAEIAAHGAQVTTVAGSIADAAAALDPEAARHGWFSLATLREPYRVEGKKVMGFELLYDLGRLPDAIVYPTGGGTGLIGMWKAFDEMEALGLIGSARPRMFAVQAEACAPLPRAFDAGLDTMPAWEAPGATAAYGLRVPGALGDGLMLKALRKSRGAAIAVGEKELLEGARLLATHAGLFASAEGGATVAAARRLLASGALHRRDTVVLFNTGHALKYLLPVRR